MSDLKKLTTEEIRAFSSDKAREVLGDLAKEMALARMDLFSDKSKHVHLVRNHRKTIARIKTVMTEKRNQK